MRQSTAVLGCLAAMMGSTAAQNCKSRDVWARNSTGEGGYCSAYPELIPASTHLTNEWGWNNWVEADVTAVTLDLWAGATGCDTAQGELVGKLDVTYDGKDATVTFLPAPGVTFTMWNVYLGCPKWYVQPANGEITNQYMKLPLGGGPGPHVYDVGSHGFYVQAHAQQKFCPDCPISMSVNGTADFEKSCECKKFNCDKPTQPWSSRNMRFCRNCPAFLEDSYHFSCPHCAAAGTEVSFTCPNQWEACDVFVQAHSTCATGSTDGGLPYNLVSEGWTAGSCGPSFCLPFDVTCQNPGNNTAVVQFPETNIKWGMVLFHKQFAGGEEMPIPQFATEPTMYFTFFVREGRFCSNDKNETECAQGPSVCAWDAQRQDPCHAELCPPKPHQIPPAGPCCDVPAGVSDGDCGAAETAITSVCSFNIPQCNTP